MKRQFPGELCWLHAPLLVMPASVIPALLTLGLLMLAAPSRASAACSGRIRSTDLAATLAYDGFAPLDATAIKDIRIDNTGSDDCAYWLAFYRNPAAPARLAERIVYEVRDAGGGTLLSDRPPTVAPERFLATGKIRGGQSDRVEYQWTILRGQVVAAGAPADSIDLRLFEAGTNTLLDTRALRLTANVIANVSINLAGAEVSSPHTHTMNFGTLETGESKSVQVQVRSNQRFRLDVASTHGGRMRQAPPFDSWWVDYTATLGERTLHFPDSIGPFDSTTVNGLSMPFRVTIGDVSNKRAGVYRDEITITIAPAA